MAGYQARDQYNNKVYVSPYWPVGAIYLSVTSTNPSTYFGGTWEQIAKGRTLVGVDTSDSDFNFVKKTGGEKTHTLIINEMPKHNHKQSLLGGSSGNKDGKAGYSWSVPTNQYDYDGYDLAQLTGGNQPHNNLQPYFTCYIWLRTA